MHNLKFVFAKGVKKEFTEQSHLGLSVEPHPSLPCQELLSHVFLTEGPDVFLAWES